MISPWLLTPAAPYVNGVAAIAPLPHRAELERLATLQEDNGTISCLCTLTELNAFASGSREGALILWSDLGKRKIYLQTRGPWLGGMACAPTGRVLATGDKEGVLKIWDVKKRVPIVTVRPSQETRPTFIGPMIFSPDGESVVFGDGAGNVGRWKKGKNRSAVRVKAHTGPIRALAFAPGERFFCSAGEDGRIVIWNAKEMKQEAVLVDEANDTIHALQFARDGTSLWAASTQSIVLWDMVKRRITWRAGQGALSLCASGDGDMLIAGGPYGRIELWDTKTKSRIFSGRGHSDRIDAMVLLPDGMTVVSGSAERARQFDVLTGRGEVLTGRGEIKIWRIKMD
jgi:WD40 repeat protein